MIGPPTLVLLYSMEFRGQSNLKPFGSTSERLRPDGGRKLTDQRDNEDIDEVGGFVFGQVEDRTTSGSDVPSNEATRNEGDSLSEENLARLADVVELQPTKNKELQERWEFDSGSEVHRYLESDLKQYYYRDESSLIHATDEAERLMDENDSSRGSPGQETSGEGSSGSGSSTSEPIDLRDRDLIIALVGLAQELGRLPTAGDINDRCQYSHQQYCLVFGSLVAAYKQAGLVPEDVSEAELTACSTTQSSSEIENEEKSTSDTSLSSPVSSGQEGGSEGDTPPGASSTSEEPGTQEQTEDDDTHSVEITTDNLIQEIQRFAESIDEPPTEDLVTAYGEYELRAYETVFDSWDQALKEAGFDSAEVPDRSNRKYTNTEILDAISNLAEELGYPPTTTEMNKHGDVTGGIGSLRFGSWADAVRFAGLNPDERPSVQRGTAVSDGSRDQSGSPPADDDSSGGGVATTLESTDAHTEGESGLEELTTVSGVLESDAIALSEAGYTSREALVDASIDDLKEIDGISLQLALRIKADVEE